MDFPPLGAPSASRGDKYTPPARRAPTGSATTRGVPVDPAIIHSQLSRPGSQKQTGSYARPDQSQHLRAATPKPAAPAPSAPAPVPAPVPAAATAVPALAATPAATKPASYAPVSEQIVPKANASTAATTALSVEVPNASSTVERDVVTAFKGFANEQRSQAEKMRLTKIKAEKELKLKELKAFASSFKLERPLPQDLVPIMTKDPVKQRAIQETAKRQAEEAKREKEKAQAAKAEAQSASTTTTPGDTKIPQRPAVATVPTAQNSSSRPTANRAPNAPHGGYNNNQQHFRQDRNMRQNQSQVHGGYQGPNVPVSQRPNNNRYGTHEHRQPPTGPADPSASRRTSGAGMVPRLNPNSTAFRPNASAFKPDTKPSNVSTPRSEQSEGPPVCPSASGLLIKRRPSEKKATKPTMSIMDRLVAEQPPAGRDWTHTGGIRPAFDTLPTWKQVKDDEPADSNMNITYAKLFEKARFPAQPVSSPLPIPLHPQGVPHQHQLPFHLQQGAHMSQRPSPRQQPGHMNNHGIGQHQQFIANDDHRMMPSHSAQSFASPRMTPMVAYAQGVPPVGMQQPVYMGQGAPQMGQFNRSYSGGGGQFIPQQQMGQPVIMGSPGAFYGAPNMMGPGPVMMYPGAHAMGFPPQGGPPAPMPAANGYPSPGPRMAPMMTPSGSQQGQPPVFQQMSPAMQYGQPMYAQQGPPHSKSTLQRRNVFEDSPDRVRVHPNIHDLRVALYPPFQRFALHDYSVFFPPSEATMGIPAHTRHPSEISSGEIYYDTPRRLRLLEISNAAYDDIPHRRQASESSSGGSRVSQNPFFERRFPVSQPNRGNAHRFTDRQSWEIAVSRAAAVLPEVSELSAFATRYDLRTPLETRGSEMSSFGRGDYDRTPVRPRGSEMTSFGRKDYGRTPGRAMGSEVSPFSRKDYAGTPTGPKSTEGSPFGRDSGGTPVKCRFGAHQKSDTRTVQPQMRGYPHGSQFGQNQMPHYNQHHSRPNGNYNRNSHQQQQNHGPNHNQQIQQNGTHPASSPNPALKGPQQPAPDATESK